MLLTSKQGKILITVIYFICCCFSISTSNQHSPLGNYQQQSANCTVPTNLTCPPPSQICANFSTIIIVSDTAYSCNNPLNITGPEVIMQGGTFQGTINIIADNFSINGSPIIIGNLSVYYSSSVLLSSSTLTVSNITIMIPVSNQTLPNTSITILNSIVQSKKIFLSANSLQLENSLIMTSPNICLYQFINTIELMKISETGIQNFVISLVSGPINIIMSAQNNIFANNLTINTTIIGIFSKNSNFVHSTINTTASSCFTNLGMGKGLQAQMANQNYCSSGGSSGGYGTYSTPECVVILQYFMFISHSFPYLSRGASVSTGSGGYGYRQGIGNQGAGGGIIFLYSKEQFYTYQSFFLANGGEVSGNYSISAGSGGTVSLYCSTLSGQHSNFSASGGASYNNNGSGAGGIIKMLFTDGNFSTEDYMWVNVSQGFQPNLDQNKTYFQNNGLFYGPICVPGTWGWYLSCVPCFNGSYSLLGDTSCQMCPSSNSYSASNISGISEITQCFNKKDERNNFHFIRSPSRLGWSFLVLYIAGLVIIITAGNIIKKRYKKKLTVMETESFSLQQAKKDLEESRILTEKLKSEKNIKFEDLMYHIHRITLFGSNNPQCPWALPQFPPQQIKKYILRQGFIDFSVKFNKVAKWTKFEKLLGNLSFLVYPLHWYYYDKVKKSKYKKLLELLEESKEFNLINNYDFEDKNMVTIKISKNTDYTICYLDFMVYDRADTKYFNLNAPFIISISGEGHFLRPFYLEDRDVFFNTLFYIINKAKQKKDELQIIDAKKQLFANLFTQKKRQENRNKLIDFLKYFNKISVTLDLSAPLSQFIPTLVELIQYIAQWNQKYFKDLSIQLDIIFMISKVKKGHVVSNEIHILTNKNPELFKQFMNKNIPKMNRYEKFDLKLGLFVYNPDQQLHTIKNRKTTGDFRRNWNRTQISEQEQIQQPLVEQHQQAQDEAGKKKKLDIFQNLVRFFGLIRYLLMTHRKLTWDKDVTKFLVTSVVLTECMLSCVWSIYFQFPYFFANIIAPFIGVLWMISGSYGIGKVFLVFNSMALLDDIITIILVNTQGFMLQMTLCQIVAIVFRILVIPLATKYLSVSRKLNTSKMFK